eukprot:CAMPEP_0201543358 /NCGR_PEP_ID=MMETSP0161_2-20130828/72555_1 /ASSEMBLY_ACC=CAM_ASM_000251 /TAXON_ID=180227 /ORGANISM="Neoparamoeba aestuarina, Strain SoJaBio B1-5/56/2" /LENGTH=368 /DNA_ID=CAMNT_0047951133 /DNA_START=531 /DNA_END=1634 /DNA_ORIENTATION=+
MLLVLAQFGFQDEKIAENRKEEGKLNDAMKKEEKTREEKEGGWGKGRRTKWRIDPTTPSLPFSPCSIDRVRFVDPSEEANYHHHHHPRPISLSTFEKDYFSLGRPVLVVGETESWTAQQRWKRSQFLKQHASLDLLGAVIPYGQIFGIDWGHATGGEYAHYLEKQNKYFDTMVSRKGSVVDEGGAVLDVEDFVGFYCEKEGEPVPLYIFDSEVLESELKEDFSSFVFMDKIFANASSKEEKGTQTEEKGQPNHRHPKSYQFALGGIGSGAPVHSHCDAVNGLVFGKKIWWLLPPSASFYSKSHPIQWLCDLMEEERGKKERGKGVGPEQVMMCVQQAGDAMFVPKRWAHSTLNILNSVAVAVEYPDVG